MVSVYSQQRLNNQKTWLLMTIFLCLVIAISFVFAQLLGNSLILYFGVGFALIMNIFSYWYSDKMVIAMTGAEPIERSDYPEPYRILENLSIAAGLAQTPKLYLLNSDAINAFATGRNKKNAVVAVTSGALRKLNDKELEGVFAHELSHVLNSDIKIMTIATILAGVMAILANFFLNSLFWGGLGGRRRDNEGNNVIFLVIGLAVAILAPIFAQLMQLAISRKREFLADTSGVLLTRYPQGLIGALEKIGNDENILKTPPATAHLYISNPFRENKSFLGWMGNLFADHPPLDQRIKALRSVAV